MVIKFLKLHKKFLLNKNLKTIVLKYFIPWGWCVSSKHWLKFMEYETNNKRVKDGILNKIKKIVKNEKKFGLIISLNTII